MSRFDDIFNEQALYEDSKFDEQANITEQEIAAVNSPYAFKFDIYEKKDRSIVYRIISRIKQIFSMNPDLDNIQSEYSFISSSDGTIEDVKENPYYTSLIVRCSCEPTSMENFIEMMFKLKKYVFTAEKNPRVYCTFHYNLDASGEKSDLSYDIYYGTSVDFSPNKHLDFFNGSADGYQRGLIRELGYGTYDTINEYDIKQAWFMVENRKRVFDTWDRNRQCRQLTVRTHEDVYHHRDNYIVLYGKSYTELCWRLLILSKTVNTVYNYDVETLCNFLKDCAMYVEKVLLDKPNPHEDYELSDIATMLLNNILIAQEDNVRNLMSMLVESINNYDLEPMLKNKTFYCIP